MEPLDFVDVGGEVSIVFLVSGIGGEYSAKPLRDRIPVDVLETESSQPRKVARQLRGLEVDVSAQKDAIGEEDRRAILSQG